MNLRCLAEVQLLAWLPLLALVLKLGASAAVLIWRLATEPYDPNELVPVGTGHAGTH